MVIQEHEATCLMRHPLAIDKHVGHWRKRRILVLVNPFAGTKNGVNIFRSVEHVFHRAHIEVKMIGTGAQWNLSH